MLCRVIAVMFNTYREAVRARVLHGLLSLSFFTAGYSIVVAEFALKSSLRVVSDLGAASVSLYGIVVAVVLSATSLYRELELKTLFPILARPIRRTEYLVGKYLGTLLTIAVFIAANAGVLLLSLAFIAGRSPAVLLGVFSGVALAAFAAAFLLPRARTYLPIAWAVGLLLAGLVLSSGAPDDRRVVIGAAVLSLCEVGVVAAIATVFAAFSSPFLTAIFTFGVFIVGRSADTLSHLPARVFGDAIHALGAALSRIVPNLMIYVPPRPLLTGESAGVTFAEYLPIAAAHALAWSAGLLALSSIIFRRRDFL